MFSQLFVFERDLLRYGTMCSFFLSLLARFLLWILGWNKLTRTTSETLKGLPNCIGIYPHTSIWDGVIFACYKLSYPTLFPSFYTLVTERFWIWPLSWIFANTGCICINNSKIGCNQTEKILNVLRNQKSWVLFLSPKGTTNPKPWRKGFLVLATQLSVPIYVFGLNYLTHEAEVFDFPFVLETLLKDISPISSMIISSDEVRNFVPTGNELRTQDLRLLKTGLVHFLQKLHPLYYTNEIEIPYEKKNGTVCARKYLIAFHKLIEYRRGYDGKNST